MVSKRLLIPLKWKCMTKILLKILKSLFSKEIEVAPGVFWLGGYLYENRNNKPTTPRPLKWKKSND